MNRSALPAFGRVSYQHNGATVDCSEMCQRRQQRSGLVRLIHVNFGTKVGLDRIDHNKARLILLYGALQDRQVLQGEDLFFPTALAGVTPSCQRLDLLTVSPSGFETRLD